MIKKVGKYALKEGTRNIKRYTAEDKVSLEKVLDTHQLSLGLTQTGFLSLDSDDLELPRDLSHYMVKNAPFTFFFKISGQTMTDFGIYDGDLLVVDRSREVYNGCIVMARIDDEWTVKKFVRKKEKTLLMPSTNKIKKIDVTGQEFALVWGVVTYAIHKGK